MKILLGDIYCFEKSLDIIFFAKRILIYALIRYIPFYLVYKKNHYASRSIIPYLENI
jgi:hypothetical protein